MQELSELEIDKQHMAFARNCLYIDFSEKVGGELSPLGANVYFNIIKDRQDICSGPMALGKLLSDEEWGSC